MIGYVTVGTNDLAKAADFYDELLAGIGAKRFMEMETFIAWSNDPSAAGFSITKPFDGNPASVGNGVMIALMVDSTDKVDALYAKAIELEIKKLKDGKKTKWTAVFDNNEWREQLKK